MNQIEKSDFFEVGKNGVKRILTPDDRKIDIIDFEDKKLCYVKSGMGYPAIYPMHETHFEPKAEAILMDLDGTSVHSESFWMWVIEQTTARLLGNSNFKREVEDEPFISGHSVSEHLQYMIDKYAKGGLKMLTRNIASEYGEYNIQCNGIGPGYIATPQTAPLREIQPDGERHPFDKFIIAKTPAARWGNPEDLEGPAIFLASDASNFVNGHILYVDGGILAYIGKQP